MICSKLLHTWYDVGYDADISYAGTYISRDTNHTQRSHGPKKNTQISSVKSKQENVTSQYNFHP